MKKLGDLSNSACEVKLLECLPEELDLSAMERAWPCPSNVICWLRVFNHNLWEEGALLFNEPKLLFYFNKLIINTAFY